MHKFLSIIARPGSSVSRSPVAVTIDNEISNATMDNSTKPPAFELSSDRQSLGIILPMTCIYCMILLAGLIGNISTCILIAKYEYMQTATNCYKFSLAISDLLLLIIGLPMETYGFWFPNRSPYGKHESIVKEIATEASNNATVLIITAFTVKRYKDICHPLLSHTPESELSRPLSNIIAIWVISVSAATLLAILTEVKPQACHEAQGSKLYAFAVSAILFFVLPMILIAVLDILISVELRARDGSANIHENSYVIRNTRSRYVNSRFKDKYVDRMLFLTVAVSLSFFVCWAPFHVHRLLAVYSDEILEPSTKFNEVSVVLTKVSGITYYLSTVINPILYNALSTNFRRALKSTLPSCCLPDTVHQVTASTELRRNEMVLLRQIM